MVTFSELEYVLNIVKLVRPKHIKMTPQEMNIICCRVCVGIAQL